MSEKGTKRREWIKSAAIVFLVILLLLTFFSQTIQNYSLPEVSTEYVQSGSISTKVRGSGVVQSGDPYNVMVKETRKVQSVAVRVGDKVSKGDVIFYLSAKDSTELEAAKETLRNAQESYDRALLNVDIDASIISEAQKDVSVQTYRDKISLYQKQIQAAQTEVDAAALAVSQWQNQIQALETQISITPENNADLTLEQKVLDTAKYELDLAKFNLTDKQNKVKELEAKIEVESAIPDNDAVVEDLQNQLIEANRAQAEAETSVDYYALELEKHQKAYDLKVASGNTDAILANLNNQLGTARSSLLHCQNTLTQKQEALDKITGEMNSYVSDITSAMNLSDLYNAVITARKEVEKLEAESAGSEVVAEIDGTISALNVAAGQETNSFDAMAVIQPEGQGYTMSFSVTADQAKVLKVGDKASVVNSWYYNDLNIVLDSIKPDRTDPQKKKVLNFVVTGDVAEGQSLNISVGQKNTNYDLVVPNNAVREDNNGKFLLQVEVKSSPLGNRYVATRVDVEVINSDDLHSAVRGALYGWEYVITNSTKPIEAGQLVRLKE